MALFKKDFIKLAKILKDNRSRMKEEDFNILFRDIMRLCAESNGNFSIQKFTEAVNND